MKKTELKTLISEEIQKILKEAKPSEDGAQYIGKTIDQIN